MNLNEVDIDDVELSEGDGKQPLFDEDTYEKPWMTGVEETEDPEPEEENEPDLVSDEDIITILLKDKGINPDSVKFQNENGEIEEKRFEDLTKEEQLQILNYNEIQDNYGLEDDEVGLINELRESNLSVDEYKQLIANKAIQEFVANNDSTTSTYEVDSIPDDELYIIDLKAKIPELTDEDANSELELAKQNETLYQKKIQSIRNEYKQKEDLLVKQQEEEQRLANEKEAQEFENTIIETIQENDTIDLGESSLRLSEDDMNEVASFILDSDAAGVRYIAKALNDPKTLVGMAWYALKGKEAFSQISEYYKQKITEAAKYNYTKGYDDAKKGIKPNTSKSVVRKPN